MTTPPPEPGRPDGGGPPPPPPGPWASDNLPRHPMADYVPAQVEQPPSIRNAVRLMYVGAVLSVLGVVLLPLQTDTIRSAIEDSDSSLTASQVDTAVNVAVGIGVFTGLVGVALWLWMAVMNGRGRSWARVVATVLGGLGIAITLFNLAGSRATGSGVALGIVNIALAVAILVLLYRPESSRYYDLRSR